MKTITHPTDEQPL